MTLEEVVEQLTEELTTAVNRVGEKEVVVILLPSKEYGVYVADPSAWNREQKIVYGENLLNYPNLDAVKKRLAEHPLGPDIDANGWDMGLKDTK